LRRPRRRSSRAPEEWNEKTTKRRGPNLTNRQFDDRVTSSRLRRSNTSEATAVSNARGLRSRVNSRNLSRRRISKSHPKRASSRGSLIRVRTPMSRRPPAISDANPDEPRRRDFDASLKIPSRISLTYLTFFTHPHLSPTGDAQFIVSLEAHAGFCRVVEIRTTGRPHPHRFPRPLQANALRCRRPSRRLILLVISASRVTTR